ncbi:MAG: cytochrome c biogenesis protein CcsA [Phycisphaerae bacterium]|nr:cytochrome c biogenesis protein CcsA [Phycisphaerae bacterium]
MNGEIPLLRILGSMWFAAVLLVLVLAAMACATVFEATHGTERALADFYAADWFAWLLGLLAVNVLAAMLVRFPFSRRQIGFVLTHVSILVVLGGALVTKAIGIDGQVGIAEGETVEDITLPGQPVLAVINRRDQCQAVAELEPSVFNGFHAADSPRAEALVLGNLRIEVSRYLPDSEFSREVVDDNPHEQPAIQISLSASGSGNPDWVFANQVTQVGATEVALRMVPTTEELLRLVNDPSAGQLDSKGTVRIEHKGETFDIPLEQCTDQAAVVGETGYTVRVLRYLPHATVGAGGRITNASPQPVNPYIEAELVGPDGTEQRRSFANFPDFGAMHGSKDANGRDLKLVFVAAANTSPASPVEVLSGPDGEMYVRFNRVGKAPVCEKLTVGTPVDAPWPGHKFTVLRRLEHANLHEVARVVEPARETRIPAVLLKLTTDDHTNEMWVRKHRPETVHIDGVPYEISFNSKVLPLTFKLTLNQFHMDMYPGTHSPLTYESHVAIRDLDTGNTLNRVVSMNQPVQHGGFSFYQSSYIKDRDGYISILSVSRDPGQPIVYAGYIGMIVGMVWVLVQRMKRRRVTPTAETSEAENRKPETESGPTRQTGATGFSPYGGAQKGRATGFSPCGRAQKGRATGFSPCGRAQERGAASLARVQRSNLNARRRATTHWDGLLTATRLGTRASSLFRRFAVSSFRRFVVSLFRRFAVSPFRRFGVSPFRRFGVSPFRRFGVSPFRRFDVSTFLMLSLVTVGLAAPPPAKAEARLPQSLDLTIVRAVPIQHDGRWMPLDTVARDLVEQVTGNAFHQGNDPVALLLAWTFDPQAWMDEPLITIKNAELRAKLKLSSSQTVYSYTQLVENRHFMSLVDGLARIPRDRKMNPLESKVSDISHRLGILHDVLNNQAIRLIPDPTEANAAWRPISMTAPDPTTDDESAAEDTAPEGDLLRIAWLALGKSFLEDDATRFATASRRLTEVLAALPAAYRPDPKLIETELHYNQLAPFTLAWKITALGALLGAAAMLVRRRWFDGVALVTLFAGFAVLTYGLSLRWQIAGRLPTSNMYESLLILSWGMGLFAMVAILVFPHRLVPLTASVMAALSLCLADILPLDAYIRPIVPVLRDTFWMATHVPVIMVSYSVLALGVLIAHVQVAVMAVAPRRRELIDTIDSLHYWYIHVGSILLWVGIVTGSMWAMASWGRYWGWDPKEVWSLVALLGYLTILHVRINREKVPAWAYVVAVLLAFGVFVMVLPALLPITGVEALVIGGAILAMAFLVLARGKFATALKSILCFWLIIMAYVGVNFVLGMGLHSYGFGKGAVVRYLFVIGGIDLLLMAICAAAYLLRRRESAPPAAGFPVVVSG